MSSVKFTHRSRNEWEKILSTWESSGLSQADFCKREGISKSVFNKYKLKLRGSSVNKIKKSNLHPEKVNFVEAKHICNKK